MNKKTKHLLSSVLFALTSILYFFFAYIGYGKQNIDLKTKSMYENIVTDKGVGIRYDLKGKESSVFYLSLKGFNEKLGIYRMSNNYDDLLAKSNIGEKVKVYYQPNSEEEKLPLTIGLMKEPVMAGWIL